MSIRGLALTPKIKLGILILDSVLFVLIMAASTHYRTSVDYGVIFQALGLWFQLFIVISLSYLLGSYDVNQPRFRKVALAKTVAVFVAVVFIVIVNFLLYKERSGLFGRGVLIGSAIIYNLLAIALRFVYWKRYHHFVGKVELNFLIHSRDHQVLEQDLKSKKFSSSYQVFFLEQFDQLLQKFEKADSPILVMGVDPTGLEISQQQRLFEKKLKGLRIYDLSDFYEKTWANVPIYHLQWRWFLVAEGFGVVSDQLRNRLKRLFDLFLSSTILLLTWPLMLFAALAIRLDSKGPLFYWQIRVGKNGETFKIVKFRSMKTDAEANGPQWAQQNDSRITRVGKILRKTRIDELPQIWNIIQGDMSFIGPRPERPEFVADLEKQIPFYQMRHAIRPGLTGWAQVCYRYGASVEDAKEKLQYEIFYIKHHSIWLDFHIILRTVKIVLGMKGT